MTVRPEPRSRIPLKALKGLRLRKPEVRAERRRLQKAVSVRDLRAIARRRLPRGVFDYIDGGAEDELTLAANSEAFGNVVFLPRVLRGVGAIDISSTLLGKRLAFPLVLGPTGFTRIAHPSGELAVARSASRFGVPYALSTLGTRTIEEVAAVSTGRLWFQVYVWKDRGLVAELVKRAAAANYEALCITVDTAVLGKRERDARRGFTLPPKIGISTLLDGMIHPGWTWQFLRSEPILFANVKGRGVGDGQNAISLAEYVGRQFDPGLSWRDVEWLRELWGGKIVLKGIQTLEDAKLAADIEVDAIAVSNHGGRQLDSARASLDLIPDVATSVGDRLEIICDGGVRRGGDIVKAIALGAKACMAGRAYLYGLASAGEAGVDHVLSLFAADVARTMALLGVGQMCDIDKAYVAFKQARGTMEPVGRPISD